ncbi:MAG: 5-formyltetrahydrofolate cyclo-ligase [Gemmataceae bacterium]|nr:5-formyltetrahydrofolate cyclo-ligase [Gemmataceae bacterium]
MTDLDSAKAVVRERCRKARAARPDKDAASRAIVAAFTALPAYADARTVMWYVDAGGEVRTRPALPAALADGKRLVVPWCDGEANELGLFHLEDLGELVEGAYRILEPREELRRLSGKVVRPDELDVVMVPGVAFDPRGGRVGQGRGYYDWLLARLRADAEVVGLAFDCQVVDEVPVGPRDVFMGLVLTEKRVLRGRGRGG